jgi:hypothetical protein
MVAQGQTIVPASAPVATSVTIYRAPYDNFATGNSTQAPSWLEGYALIAETRDVDLPAGPAVIRFPGVAAGMLAESVVVSGLPAGVREKNLDAQLLSPRSLYAGWFGRPVILRRQDPATGATREEPAVIRSGADGAAVIETAQGFEALNCGPFTDRLAYPDIPPGLFTSPTLSVATDAPAPAHVRVKIAYLAWNYDWRADYVLKLAADRRHGELSAWVTLASADVTGFAGTRVAVVAGKPQFSDVHARSDDDDELTYQCFPKPPAQAVPPLPAMMLDAPAPMAMARSDIVVTAMRKVVYPTAENLGDLKLFRLPLPTTLAPQAQKQVALFAPRKIAVAIVHTADLDDFDGQAPARLLLRSRNDNANGLGLALPGGRVRVLARAQARDLVVGQGTIADRAINDRLDISTAETPQVMVEQHVTHRGRTARAASVTVSNANRFAVDFLGRFAQTAPGSIRDATAPLASEDGHKVWAVRIPAHGRVTLRYRIAEG